MTHTATATPTRTGPGLDVPDARGRTGLDQAGRNLDGNPDVVVRDVELLAAGWHVLRRTTFDYRHADGMLVETAAGLLDADDPVTAVRRETAEELGVVVGELEHVFDLWMSPGSVTERLHFYAAPYSPADRTGAGGGLPDDGEDIEVLELDIDDALSGIGTGRIADAKTVILLQWAALHGPFRAAG